MQKTRNTVIGLLLAGLLSAGGYAQVKDKNTGTVSAAVVTKDLVVKETPASRELDSLARTQTADQAALNVKLQQARAALDQSNKTVQDELTSIEKTLQEQLQSDKKYKPLLDKIKDLTKKSQDLNSTAGAAFQKDTAELQSKLQVEHNQIDGLIKVVKEEAGLPESATFDVATQKWSIPKK
jgi:DNA repair exonuclease SbcCD ATPase subunit